MVAGNDEAEAESVLERLEDGWWIPNLDRDVSRSSDPDHQVRVSPAFESCLFAVLFSLHHRLVLGSSFGSISFDVHHSHLVSRQIILNLLPGEGLARIS